MKVHYFFWITLLFSVNLDAQEHQDPVDGKAAQEETSAYRVTQDGKVIVEGETFASPSAYHASDRFRLGGRRCGSLTKMGERGDTTLGMAKAASDCSSSQTVIRDEYKLANTITIPVVFHILMNTNGAGDVSDGLLQSQIDVLNQDFAGLSGGFDTRIRFTMAGITRHTHNKWYNDRQEATYKSQTGWDRAVYLNIWTNLASGYLGYAYIPAGTAGDNLDGVVLHYDYVGYMPPNAGDYNLGRTATHEIGHYLGLDHTFGGGCGDANAPYTTGDLIADTNGESTPHYGCSPRATCGSSDPINSFMDYSDDVCMSNFTEEQANRMVCSLKSYRPGMGL
jgi:hypothetical protein